jgi:protein required for attachment to host cells
MQRFCLLVADAARARIFTVEPADPTQPKRGVDLHERVDLVDNERRHPPAELVSDHPGTGRSPTGLRFGVDDHRAAHVDELDRRFARELVTRLATIAREAGIGRAVVIASPSMLGVLRKEVRATLESSIAVQSIALDLTRATVAELHDRLVGLGLVPARERQPV